MNDEQTPGGIIVPESFKDEEPEPEDGAAEQEQETPAEWAVSTVEVTDNLGRTLLVRSPVFGTPPDDAVGCFAKAGLRHIVNVQTPQGARPIPLEKVIEFRIEADSVPDAFGKAVAQWKAMEADQSAAFAKEAQAEVEARMKQQAQASSQIVKAAEVPNFDRVPGMSGMNRAARRKHQRGH